MSSQKFPLGIAPSCAVDEYIGSDFDIVKKVADNMDTIESAASLVGPEASSLFTSILEKLGHKIVGSFEKGATINNPQEYVTYKEEVYHYTGDVFPYVIAANSSLNSDFKKGYRGSVEDWDAFDKALLDWANEDITGAPDTFTDSLRLQAFKKLGLSRYWKKGVTISTVGTLVRFDGLEYETIAVPAVMGDTPINDSNFRKWTVTPDDVVPGVVDQVKQLRDEAIAAASTSAAQAVSAAGSADIAKQESVKAAASAATATTAKNTATSAALAAQNSANEAKVSETTATNAASVASTAQSTVTVMNDNVNTKHADVVLKHADVNAAATTIAAQAVQVGEDALNAKQSADTAKASEQRVANNAAAAQQAEVLAVNAANNAAQSSKAATTSATESANLANAAKTSADSARTSSNDAAAASAEATAAANSVAGSEEAAALSEKNAAESAQLAEIYKTESQQASIEARNASESANTHAKAAIISATNADNSAKSIQGIADQVLPSVDQAKAYAASAKADAQIATDNAVIAGNHAVTANNSISISTTKATEALQSANAAKVSETNAKASEIKCEDIYNSMQSGVIVRGSWDACTDAYPTDKSATARWDIIVTCGDSHDFDGKTFRNGDVLYYDKMQDTFYHTPVQGAGGIVSVNGKTGTDITLTAADVGALPLKGKADNSALLDGYSKDDIVTEARTDVVTSTVLNTVLATKLDKTATATDSLKLEGKTKTEVITEARNGMASATDVYTKAQADAQFAADDEVVKKSGSVMTGQLSVPNLVVTNGLVNLTHGRLQFDSAGNTRIVSKTEYEFGLYNSGTSLKLKDADDNYFNIYHQGNKPSLIELGAYSSTGGELDGEIVFKTTPLGDAIKNAIYFGSAIESNRALWADGLTTYIGSATKETLLSGTDLKFNGKKVYYEGNVPSPAEIGALPASGKATDSSLLDGKTKNEVIAEARTGLLTSDDVYTKTQSDERYPTKVAADSKYYSDSNKPTLNDLGALPITGGVLTGELTVDNNLKVANKSKGMILNASSLGTNVGVGVDNTVGAGGLFIGGIDNTYIRTGNATEHPKFYKDGVSYNFYYEGNKPTLNELGAVNKAGDTMTGRLTVPSLTVENGVMNTPGGALQVEPAGNVLLKPKNGNLFGIVNNGSDLRFYKDGVWGDVFSDHNKPTASDVGALPIGGGTLTGDLYTTKRMYSGGAPSSWIIGFVPGGASYHINYMGNTSGFSSWMSQKTPGGGWAFGTLGDTYYLKWATKADIDSVTNTTTEVLSANNAGDIIAGRNMYANTFYARSGAGSFVSSLDTAQGIYIDPHSDTTILSAGDTSSGNIQLRPRGFNSNVGRMTLASTGAITTSGSMTIGDAYARAGGSSKTYGAIDVAGSKGGYSGIYFRDANRTFMVSGAVQGVFHNELSVWQWYFENGVLKAGYIPWSRLTSVPTTATRWPTWNEVSGKPNVANEWVSFYSSTVKQSRIAIPTAARNALNAGKSVRFEVGCQSTSDFGTATVIFPAHMWPSGAKHRVNSIAAGFSYFWIHNSNSGWGSNANYLTFENSNCIYAAYQIIG